MVIQIGYSKQNDKYGHEKQHLELISITGDTTGI